MIQLLLIKTTPHFQLLTMSKVDQSYLRIPEAPPLQKAKSQVIRLLFGLVNLNFLLFSYSVTVSPGDMQSPSLL